MPFLLYLTNATELHYYDFMQISDQFNSSHTKGTRLTRVRATLTHILKSDHGPFSVAELLQRLRVRGLRANKTTVYRQLEFFRREDLIKEVNLGEKQSRYEWSERDHHHHVVCLKCRKVEAVRLSEDLQRQERFIEQEKKFIINHHELEFFGLCRKCQ